jgi:hypothetical protein
MAPDPTSYIFHSLVCISYRTFEIDYCSLFLSFHVGHVRTCDGLKPDFEKIRAVQEMPCPCNFNELDTFMGLIQYLEKFIPNLSEHTAPLRALLEKDTLWSCENQQKERFNGLIDRSIDWLFMVLRPAEEFFTNMETSLCSKDCKI